MPATMPAQPKGAPKFKIDPITKKFVSPKADAPPEPPVQTDAELEARKNDVTQAAKDIGSTIFGGKPAKKDEPVAPDPKPGDKPSTEPAPAAAAPTNVPAKKKKDKPVEIPITRQTISEVAEATAKRVAEEMMAGKKPEAKTEEPLTELAPEDNEDLTVFKEMEGTNPTKNKGLSERFIEFRTKTEPAYQEKWLADHPGQEFNPEDSEHDDFYAKNEPQFDKREYDKAQRKIEIRESVRDVLTPIEQEQKRAAAFHEAVPKITQQVDSQLHTFVKRVDPALAALLQDANGSPDLSMKAIEKMEETDPAAASVLKRLAIAPRDKKGNAIHPENYLAPMLTQIELLTKRELGFGRDPQNNPMHRKLDELADEFDAIMEQAPPEVQMREADGVVKQWVSRAKYIEMGRAIEATKDSRAVKQAKLDAIDAKYFAVDYDDLRLMLLDEFSAKAKKEIEIVNRSGARKFGKPAAAAPAVAPPKPAPSFFQNSTKPKPPAEIGGARTVSPETPSQPGSEKLGETIAGRLFA